MTNPIIQRELLAMLRQPRTVVVQVAFVATLAALIFAVWPDNAVANLGGRQARQLFGVFAYGLLVSLMLLAPAYPATAIVRERLAGTLTLLLTSPLTPLDILIGKVVSSIGFIALLLALSLPAAACCWVMGGIGIATIAATYALMLLIATKYCLIALYVSSRVKSTDAALRITYGTILLTAIIVLGPYYMLQGRQFTPETVAAILPETAHAIVKTLPAPVFTAIKWLVDWTVALSPIPAVNELLDRTGIGMRGMEATLNFTTRYVIAALVVCAACAVLLLGRLQPHATDRVRDKGVVTDDQGRNVQVYRRVMYLWFFDPQRRSELTGFRVAWIGSLAFMIAALGYLAWALLGKDMVIPASLTALLCIGFLVTLLNHLISANPVTTKEFRTRTFGRTHWMVRIIGVCLIVSLVLMLLATLGTMWTTTEYMGGVLVVFQIGLIILLAPALASALICGEVESGGWTLLQMTPLSAFSIVLGKLLSVAWTLLLVLLATLPGYAVLLKIDQGQGQRVVDVLISLSVTAVFAMLVGAACSACLRRTSAATAAAYMILVGLCVVTLLPWLGEGTLFGRSLVERVLAFNPLAAALSAMRMPGMADYDLTPVNWYILGAGSLIAVAILWVRTWRLTQAS